jgi:hypothetical protein
LCDTLSTKCLAALELLSFDACQRIEHGSYQQKDGRNNQTGRLGPDAYPLNSAHYKVYGGAHVIGAELANESVELGRRWADAEEERDLDEDDDERTNSIQSISGRLENQGRWEDDLQAYNAKGDDKVGVEDVGDSEREAQEYAQHPSPGISVSMCCPLNAIHVCACTTTYCREAESLHVAL